MKKIEIIIVLSAILILGSAINIAAEGQADNNLTTKDSTSSANVTIGNNLLKVDGNDSTLDLRVGNRGVSMLESLESGRKFKYRKYSDDDRTWDQDEDDGRHYWRRNRFRGHWAGIELGFNNYATSGTSLVLPDNINYMSLNSGKSTNFNINFAQLSLGFCRHIGFVTGLGLNWNNYRFDGNNNIVKGDNGVIEQLDPGAKLDKSKLATLFLDIPFILEFQIPVHHNNLSLAAGPIGAIKLSSHTKMVFEDGHEAKSWEDFSLNMLRYGGTIRAGYGNFQVFATYYKTPLFSNGKGPGGIDLYPYEIGVALSFNN